MHRLFLAFALVLALAPALVHTARAYEYWCVDDPILEIDGHLVTLAIGVGADPATVDRAVQLAETTIFLPKGVTARKVETTHTFFKETVRFRELPVGWQSGQPVPVTIDVTFKAKTDLPTRMDMAVDGVSAGTVTGSTAGGMTASIVLR